MTESAKAIRKSERPILFSTPMVRAILGGTKTQTRRVVKPQPPDWQDLMMMSSKNGKARCRKVAADWPDDERDDIDFPYGQPGDRLWVREKFSVGEDLGEGWEPWMSQGDRFVLFEDGYQDYKVPDDYLIPRNAKETHHNEQGADHWRQFGTIPSIHMPRWASRILLEITAVRVERLQDISEADAIAEGAPGGHGVIPGYGYAATPFEHYRHIWEQLNGPSSWAANPWVWVIEFKRMEVGHA